MQGNSQLGQELGAALSGLSTLPSLTSLHLRGCGLTGLPQSLSALSRLAWLGVGGCRSLGFAGESCWQPLGALAASLTFLGEGMGEGEGMGV